ncbi:MAG: trypsin-like peptidase domain-containing protein [Bacteriovoracaceae bacterium]|nr:trypsin-like peptidase domain-containing protein [Bacteriovoracaceae bacterium]
MNLTTSIHFFVFLTTTLLIASANAIIPASAPDVFSIYGRDDRIDVRLYPDPVPEISIIDYKLKAKSVAGLVNFYDLYPNEDNPNLIDFDLVSAYDYLPACAEDTRFMDQYLLPGCSGTLVAPNKILTAAHCIVNKEQCLQRRWVFDYIDTTTSIKRENIYRCTDVVSVNVDTNTVIFDYAIATLDRPVTDRKPLELRTQGSVADGTELVVIGHPYGLPLKIADNGFVSPFYQHDEVTNPTSYMQKRKYYFYANLDTFVGNSGSPVFNKQTGLVEGILIRGGVDFKGIQDPNTGDWCQKILHQGDSIELAKEMVLRITTIPEL